MASAVRFTTAELVENRGRIAGRRRAGAGHRAECFAELASLASPMNARSARDAPPRLPSSMSPPALAELAEEQSYCRPAVDSRRPSQIRGGRHPVVEQALAPTGAALHRERLRAGRAAERAGSGWSPARTWPASRPSCARTHSSPSWRRWARSCRRARPTSASSTGCSPASAPPTIWRAGARPSWSRWSRRPPSSTRRPSARSSSSTRSAAARRPSMASRSPGRWWSTCTRSTAAARCSPRTITS